MSVNEGRERVKSMLIPLIRVVLSTGVCTYTLFSKHLYSRGCLLWPLGPADLMIRALCALNVYDCGEGSGRSRATVSKSPLAVYVCVCVGGPQCTLFTGQLK